MNTRSPNRAARSWNTLPIDVLEGGRVSSPVTTPRIITGASVNKPGTRVAISISPTDVRAPESCSDTVLPRFARRQMAASLTRSAGCAGRQCRAHLVDYHQPVQRGLRHITGVDQSVQPRP